MDLRRCVPCSLGKKDDRVSGRWGAMLVGRVSQYWILSCKSRYRSDDTLKKSLAKLPWHLWGSQVLAPPYCPERGSFPITLWSVPTGPIIPSFRVKMLCFFPFGGCTGLFCHNLPMPGGHRKGKQHEVKQLWSWSCTVGCPPPAFLHSILTTKPSSPGWRPRAGLAKMDRPQSESWLYCLLAG